MCVCVCMSVCCVLVCMYVCVCVCLLHMPSCSCSCSSSCSSSSFFLLLFLLVVVVVAHNLICYFPYWPYMKQHPTIIAVKQSVVSSSYNSPLLASSHWWYSNTGLLFTPCRRICGILTAVFYSTNNHQHSFVSTTFYSSVYCLCKRPRVSRCLFSYKTYFLNFFNSVCLRLVMYVSMRHHSS